MAELTFLGAARTATGSKYVLDLVERMATGGRALHHLAAALPNARNTALFVGHQAEGTRGRLLVDGGTTVRIHGRMVPVAARVARIDGHARVVDPPAPELERSRAQSS